MKAHNLAGKRFGKLTVLSRDETSDKWGQSRWQCVCDCSNTSIVVAGSLLKKLSTSCGCVSDKRKAAAREMCFNRRGANHPRWKGGRFVNSKGYVVVTNPDYENRKRHQMFEHVLVMGRKLERKLLPNETVHHKNGIRSDNNEDNLELWASNHPAGQRVSDLLTFAEQIFRTYAPSRLVD